MNAQKIRYLLSQQRAGLLSEEEEQDLTSLLQDPAYEELIQEELIRSLQENQPAPAPLLSGNPQGHPDWQPVLQRILSVDKTVRHQGRLFSFPILKWSAAAVLILALAGGGILFLTRNKKDPKSLAIIPAHPAANIVPGSNQAVLTLANGQQIILNNAQNGVLSKQGNIQVIKLDSGKLAYTTTSNDKPSPANEVTYNIISTPRGGQYQITLPDETKVWLNAESSLRFPTSFTDKERNVQLTGEAYFEVAQNKDKPFVVKANQTETRVLGTHFNIMAYGDENAVRTTLLEGSVQMGQGMQSSLLHPGEEGVFDIRGGDIRTRAVNTRAAIAWKEGYYYFDRTPVQSVMRQIARWYNVDIVYQGAIPRDEIVGKIPRTAYVSEVLHIMELIGIRFKIEDRKIIVLS
jgi:ferric-dicitrate binding protein FerR (iron transport regulator)